MKHLLAFILFSIALFNCKKKIENSKPKIQNIQQTQKISDATRNYTNFWKGEYHFEASNRDEAKTVFNITINSLENISVDVTEEGTTNKYSKLRAEELNPQKIKIKYDDSPDEMGIIYIEKSDDNYFISGNPIYFINPGNNEMPLQKLKDK
ncbi:hypothetical protein SAMN06265171_111105 [Chryseobacterium rhizoplanae]|uniref:Uncharacterized protein n=1 Tax=Chryseobacterium rhizoplanae TaxID=1609531 RepID=A0A521F428_9FLAO|nr:hypothetical protein [Chryseobacterium rhizoplanae]SMO90884.1 hypothetical protein SAMN06265171_111105 [Chryseobacterium rhizoplanae]